MRFALTEEQSDLVATVRTLIAKRSDGSAVARRSVRARV